MQARANLKRIAAMRKLMGIAKAQADELDYLRQELDRLCAKTFPRFSHATKTRLGITDNA
jgi:hypothetical protein